MNELILLGWLGWYGYYCTCSENGIDNNLWLFVRNPDDRFKMRSDIEHRLKMYD
jgi:hypothetical protein